VEDRRSPHVASEFDFSQQLPHLGTIQSLRCECHTPQFLDPGDWIRCDVSLVEKPAEEPSEADQRPVHGGDGLILLTSKMLTEVGHVPGRCSARPEWFSVDASEPTSELPHVEGERFAGAGGEIVGVEETGEQSCLPLASWDVCEHIIRRIIHGLSL